MVKLVRIRGSTGDTVTRHLRDVLDQHCLFMCWKELMPSSIFIFASLLVLLKWTLLWLEAQQCRLQWLCAIVVLTRVSLGSGRVRSDPPLTHPARVCRVSNPDPDPDPDPALSGSTLTVTLRKHNLWDKATVFVNYDGTSAQPCRVVRVGLEFFCPDPDPRPTLVLTSTGLHRLHPWEEKKRVQPNSNSGQPFAGKEAGIGTVSRFSLPKWVSGIRLQ
jgi:hypothetical protein